MHQQVSHLRRIGIHDLMDAALRNRASLAWQQEGFLVRILHPHVHPARQAENVVGHFIVRVPLRHFARSKLDDADARVLGLDQYFFSDWHIVPIVEKRIKGATLELLF